MQILVTGAGGFIGENLCYQLNNFSDLKTSKFLKNDKITELNKKINNADLIIHLAGVNRPIKKSQFDKVNYGLTDKLCNLVSKYNKKIPIIFSSSIQAVEKNEYGKSKLKCEKRLIKLNKLNQNPIYIFRLPNVFGKWGKPNYNSVVTTFCFNVANGFPIEITDKEKVIKLSYIDDVIESFVKIISKRSHSNKVIRPIISPIYKITLGSLAKKIPNYNNNRFGQIIDNVAVGFNRKLYSTFISYINPNNFSYQLNKNEDKRGIFVEVFKNKKFGQISFFTSKKGALRGNHYHNTKSEKFIVLSGRAQFLFKNIINNKKYQINVSESDPIIINTVPGWAHSIKNTGKKELVVMVWANEVFNSDKPDTILIKNNK